MVQIGFVNVKELAARGKDSQGGCIKDHNHIVLGDCMSTRFFNHIVQDAMFCIGAQRVKRDLL